MRSKPEFNEMRKEKNMRTYNLTNSKLSENVSEIQGAGWFDPRTQSGRPVGNNERSAATEEIKS